MDANATLQLISWAIPKLLTHLATLRALNELADQEHAPVQIRALLRAKIAERQALAEAEATAPGA